MRSSPIPSLARIPTSRPNAFSGGSNEGGAGQTAIPPALYSAVIWRRTFEEIPKSSLAQVELAPRLLYSASVAGFVAVRTGLPLQRLGRCQQPAQLTPPEVRVTATPIIGE